MLIALMAALAVPVLHTYESLEIAPDGRRVVALESDERPDAPTALTALVVRDVASGHARVVETCEQATCRLAAPAWSPDGSFFVYIVRENKSGMQRVVRVDPEGSGRRVLASIRGDIGDPRFAPDGHALAVLATAGAHKQIGATQAGAPLVGDIGAAPDVQRIALVRSDGTLGFVSAPNLFVYEYDWLPNGGFVATGAHGNGDDNWWIARLYAIDPQGGSRELYAPALQIADPRVSPDGKQVAFIGGIMSDFGSTGGDVYAVSTSGGEAVDLTPNLAASATSLAWRGDARAVTFTGLAGAQNIVARADLDSHSVQRLWAGDVLLDAGTAHVAFARDDVTTAVVRQTFERPPEIAVGPLGAWRDLTHANAALRSAGHARNVTWKSDGFDVQGWLLEPLRAAATPGPMIVEVHGGPSAATQPRYVGPGVVRDLLEHGYAVFFPNPRGSFGQGERFTQANVKDFGGGDLRDILSGIDAAERVAPIDDARLGLIGYSYGGYMTMWAVTQTHRFKAAVAGAGVSDWLSYYGENGIDQWMIPFFGASVYDDPAVYAKSSPMTFIKDVRTPTFEFVGERDVECPMPQSQEFWHALVTLGVPTSFVVYPGEGHGIRVPAHVHDAARRTLAWFDQYLRH